MNHRTNTPATDLAPVTLFAQGKPAVRIVLGPEASATEQVAAEELRQHLCAMAGVSPRVRWSDACGGAVYINQRDIATRAGIDVAALRLAPEAFHLEARAGNVHLLSGSARGTLYGVYEILESLGCRWFTPQVSRLPRRRTIRLPATRQTHAPAFEFRDMNIWEARDPRWWVRNRLNGAYTPVPDELGGHVTYGLFVHTFWMLVPPEQYFDRHPEYFSLVNGRRVRDRGQLCLTNPEVVRVVTERVLEHMRANRKARLFSVSQNDWDGHCECSRCAALAAKEGAQSGPLLHFVNAVAAETTKVFPDNLIDTLAYSYTADAPRQVVPHPRVRVRLCPINCCMAHGFGTCDHAESARCLRALRDWSGRTRQLYIWHYATNFMNYPAPLPDFDELHHNLNLYGDAGVHGVFLQGNGQEGGGSESAALRAYVLGRLLWNPRQPVWPLVDEFLAAVYGAAASKVRDYLDLFHRRVREDRTLHPSLYDPPESRLYDGTIVRRADALLRAGEAAVRGDCRRRVRLLRHGVNFIPLARGKGLFRREGDIYRSDATADDLRHCDVMIRDWRRSGMTGIQENSTWRFSIAKFRNRLAAHRVRWLRDDRQEVAVVPGLGGRLLEWHAYGHQWLSQPQRGGPWWQTYPLQEGYQESAYLSSFAHIGWVESYPCRRSGGSLQLTLDLDDGWRLERTYALREGALHITSELQNRGAIARAIGWCGAPRWILPGPATIRFANASGTTRVAWTALPAGYDHPLMLEGERLPRGSWQAEMPGFRLTCRFSGTHLERVLFSRQDADNKLIVDLKTGFPVLVPGASLRAEQQWLLERQGHLLKSPITQGGRQPETQ